MRKFLFTSLSLTLLLVIGMVYPLTRATAHTRCYEPDLVPLGAEFLREASLCVDTQQGVSAQVKTVALTRGNAHTFWFAYVDQPSLCTGGGAGVCTPSDFGTVPPSGDSMADPLGVFGRLDSTVVDKKNGRETFSGEIGGLRLSSGSLVILLLYDHGPANSDNRLLARQLLTPEDPAAGAPGLGVLPRGARFTERAIAVFIVP